MCLSGMKKEFLPKFSIHLSDQYISIIVTMLLKSTSAAGWFCVLGPPGTPAISHQYYAQVPVQHR